MSDWSVDPVGGFWLASCVALVLLGVIFVAPRGKQLPSRRRTTLMALRASAALVMLFVWLRPTLVAIETRKLPGSLIVMLDSSRSMQVTDSVGNESRWDAVKSVLSSSREQFSQLSDAWEVKFYQFDEASEHADVVEGLPTLSDQPTGPQTAIGSALEDILDREAQQRIVAVLLLSDGAQRAFAPRDVPPQTAVQRLAVDDIPLYTFTFGQPALGLQSDLRIDDLQMNDSVFAETPVTVQAVLSAEGYTNQTYTAKLLWESADGEMEVVDTRDITIATDQRRVPLSFSHTPAVPGEYKVSVEIEAPEGELVTSNNRQDTFVSVLKGGVNILYLVGATRIGGGPSIEPRFVRSALAAHADLNVRYDLLNYRTPRLDMRGVLDEGKFDVFLLGDVDITALNNATWEAMATAIENGAGLAMLGGFHSFGPGGFRGSALESVLPIRIGRAERQNFGEPPRQDMHVAGPLRMVPVELGGKTHPILQLAGESSAKFDWAELPALDGANRFERTQIKPTSQILAETTDASRRPLLVSGAWGVGRTLAFAGDSTWRWPMEGFDDAHRRFWRQLVMWLARKDETGGQSVWVRLDGRRFQRGSQVNFSFGALDEQREVIDGATFDIQIKQPDGSTVQIGSRKSGEGHQASFAETATPGDYQITVTATVAGELLDTTQARFAVPDRDMELDQPAAEPTFLSNLANITGEAGGQGLAPEDFPRLLEELQSRTTEFEEEIRQQKSLWDTWPTLVLLVGLLGSEWYLRKRWGLV